MAIAPTVGSVVSRGALYTVAVWMFANRRCAGSILIASSSRSAAALEAGTNSMPQIGQRPFVG
jgi:hypothetical protein